MTDFVDTSALYTLLDEEDPGHSAAARCWAERVESGTSLVTHDYVAVETSALVQARLGMAAARQLHDGLLSVVRVDTVTPPVRDAGVAALLAAGRRRVSLVDWVSFEVMRRQGIEVAFAFDEDFAAQGFTVVP